MLVDPGLLGAYTGLVEDVATSNREFRRRRLYEELAQAGEQLGLATVTRLDRNKRLREFEEAKARGPAAVEDYLERESLERGDTRGAAEIFLNRRRSEEAADIAREKLGEERMRESIKAGREREEKEEEREFKSREKALEEKGRVMRDRRKEQRGAKQQAMVIAAQDRRQERSIEAQDQRIEDRGAAKETERARAVAAGTSTVLELRRSHPELVSEPMWPLLESTAQMGGNVAPILSSLVREKRMRDDAGATSSGGRNPALQVNSAMNRAAVNEYVKALRSSTKPEDAVKAAAAEDAVVKRLLTEPNADGTPRSAAEMFDTYDDLTNFQDAARGMILRRAQELDAAEDAPAAAALPELRAAQAARSERAAAEAMAKHGLTPDALARYSAKIRNRERWRGGRPAVPGDPDFNVKISGDPTKLQYLHMPRFGGYELWDRHTARRRGYTGP